MRISDWSSDVCSSDLLNGVPVKQETRPDLHLAVDENAPCAPDQFPGRKRMTADGTAYCDLPIKRETLPNGRYYDIVDLGDQTLDWYGPIKIPADHLFLMGDNRDRSADSRVSLDEDGLGGPVPVESSGVRDECITYSLNGT